jgi:hypothetical protein
LIVSSPTDESTSLGFSGVRQLSFFLSVASITTIFLGAIDGTQKGCSKKI